MAEKTLWTQMHSRETVECLVRAGVTLALSAGKVGGLYGPWALAAVALSGGRGCGFCSVLGAMLGAYLFYDFQSGLRLAASAVLIYCANMAFCDTKIAGRPAFTPCLAAGALLLVQSVYLVGRAPRHWALCFLAAVMTALAALLLRQNGKAGRPVQTLCMLTAFVGAAAPLMADGFSPGRMAAVWLVLLCSGAAAPAAAVIIGAGVGLTVDMAFAKPTLLYAVVLAAGGGCASYLKARPRWLSAAVMCLLLSLTVLTLECDYAAAMLYEALFGAVAYLVIPRRWLPQQAVDAAAEEGSRPAQAAAVPAMAREVLREGAEAYRALYEELLRPAAPSSAENPSVIFDTAADAVCRHCVLVKKCWQQEYDATYSAFNDAVGPILRRGRAEASDFPLHFATGCLHFPSLLSAIDRSTYGYLLRRQYRTRLGSAHSIMREQYAQMGETLSGTGPGGGKIRFHCRIGSSLRPREGERVCGDQLAVFTVGSMLYMLLSDGMGSGEAAHAESAMTVRLLRKFLKAGIDPKPALKTLNTALSLRCAEGGGFTTIDLLALDRSSGAATLYKYGAAPSYVKRGDRAVRINAGSLPAGLQGSSAEPESSRLQLEEGAVLVMVSDGVAGGDDGWLSEGLVQWQEMEAQDMSQQIMAESRRHGGLQDDCAVLVLRLEKSSPPDKKQV